MLRRISLTQRDPRDPCDSVFDSDTDARKGAIASLLVGVQGGATWLFFGW